MERGCLALLRGSFWFGVLSAVRYSSGLQGYLSCTENKTV